MDVSAGYICRILRSDTLQILTDVKCFEKVLKCMILTIVSKTIDVVEGINDDDTLDDL
ncbi:1359_t:CDS:2 [Funneliformis mosseae]|uniref:1359_t:CDS:1 n=1 Tax=Funneliformis mosseae TaxID=27381 RepID=A0A9N8YPD6_FUNMO|nr:1359_t:CDS:2 [Funneliformis mosseae]